MILLTAVPSCIAAALPLAAVALELDAPTISPQEVRQVVGHYYRIPKSGSTTTATLLKEMNCEIWSHSPQRVHNHGVMIHQHGDGCKDLDWCNGTKLAGVQRTDSVFAVMRPVCSRFVSTYWHMQRYSLFSKGLTMGQHLARLQEWTRGCPKGEPGVHCQVREINRRYTESHRVILWPQAFYMHPTRTAPICYHPEWLAQRFMTHVGAMAPCDVSYNGTQGLMLNAHPNKPKATPVEEITEEICKAAEAFYDEDHRLWCRHCDTC